MWYVYILECKNKSFYTGITTDVERRFKEHQNKTAHYTSYNPPIRIVHTETYLTKKQAAKREAQIKSWRRKKKLSLIKGDLKLLK